MLYVYNYIIIKYLIYFTLFLVKHTLIIFLYLFVLFFKICTSMVFSYKNVGSLILSTKKYSFLFIFCKFDVHIFAGHGFVCKIF